MELCSLVFQLQFRHLQNVPNLQLPNLYKHGKSQFLYKTQEHRVLNRWCILSIATQRKQGPKTPNVFFYPPISEQLLLLGESFLLVPPTRPFAVAHYKYLPTYLLPYSFFLWTTFFLFWFGLALQLYTIRAHHRCLPIIIGTFKIVIMNFFFLCVMYGHHIFLPIYLGLF